MQVMNPHMKKSRIMVISGIVELGLLTGILASILIGSFNCRL
jgi:hypothetical protein